MVPNHARYQAALRPVANLVSRSWRRVKAHSLPVHKRKRDLEASLHLDAIGSPKAVHGRKTDEGHHPGVDPEAGPGAAARTMALKQIGNRAHTRADRNAT